MSIRWKLFRVVCIFQFLLVALQLLNAGFYVFAGQYPGYYLYKTVCFGLILAFMSQTLSILNYNYPDLPLGLRQKRSFNMLFLLNVLMIAFLFAQLISQWRAFKYIYSLPLFSFRTLPLKSELMIFLPLVVGVVNFLLHFIFLAGAYQLRRTIHERLARTWDEKGEAG